MPKVILLGKRDIVTHTFANLVQTIRRLVAEAASTNDVQLTVDDIDFYYEEVSCFSVAPSVSIEIETIGYPERKKKLGQESVVQKLKDDILAIPDFSSVDPKKLFLWIKFWDPAGPHV